MIENKDDKDDKDYKENKEKKEINANNDIKDNRPKYPEMEFTCENSFLIDYLLSIKQDLLRIYCLIQSSNHFYFYC